MGMSEMSRRAARVLEQWDPYLIGNDLYAMEIVDVVAQLQVLDDPSDLAKQIQTIYHFTFGKWIPLEHCVAISYKLLALKYEAKCII